MLTTFNINSIFLCLSLHLSEQIKDMQATITAGMNSQKNIAINHTNKSLTRSPVKHTVRNNTQMYCIVIQNRLSVSFMSRFIWQLIL